MAREDELERRKTKLFNSKKILLAYSSRIFETRVVRLSQSSEGEP